MKRKEVDVKRALRAVAIIFGVTSLLAACGGGGGGGGTDYSQYDPGTAAPTISAPATVTAYPGGANAFKVTVLDADTAQSNVKLTGKVISYSGFPEAPTIWTTVDTGVAKSERTVEVTFADRKATGTAVVELQVSDGAQTAKTQVSISVVPSPYAVQKTEDVVVTYPAGSLENYFYTISNSRLQLVGAMQPESTLDQAARAHAAYLVANGGIGDTELAGSAGFTGASAADRARAAGYTGTGVQDVAAVIPTGVSNEVAATIAAAKLGNSVYRASILRSGMREIGIGVASANGVSVLVAVVGTKSTVQREVSSIFGFWPFLASSPGSVALSEAVEAAYVTDIESPSATHSTPGVCGGTPVSFWVRSDQTLTTKSFELSELDLAGNVVAKVPGSIVDAASDRNSRLTKNVAYFVPAGQLKKSTAYSARYVGTSSALVMGSYDIDRTWRFLTGGYEAGALMGCTVTGR